MATLSRSSILKIRRMIRAILAEPKYYDQQRFPQSGDCGATCCAAGWAVWLNNPKKYAEILKQVSESGDGWCSWPRLGEEALGIPHSHGTLFGGAFSWPEPYGIRYHRARTKAQKAQVAAERWEHYIATDGRE